MVDNEKEGDFGPLVDESVRDPEQLVAVNDDGRATKTPQSHVYFLSDADSAALVRWFESDALNVGCSSASLTISSTTHGGTRKFRMKRRLSLIRMSGTITSHQSRACGRRGLG